MGVRMGMQRFPRSVTVLVSVISEIFAIVGMAIATFIRMLDI